MLVAQSEHHRQDTTLTFDFSKKGSTKWHGTEIVYIMQSSNLRLPHRDHRTYTMPTSVPRPPDYTRPPPDTLKKKEHTHTQHQIGWCIQYRMICFKLQSENRKSSITVWMKSCTSCIHCSRTQRHGYDAKTTQNKNTKFCRCTRSSCLLFLRVSCSALQAGP